MQMLDSRGDNSGQGGGYQPRQQPAQQGGGGQHQGGAQQQNAPQQNAPQPAPANDFDDDIPF